MLIFHVFDFVVFLNERLRFFGSVKFSASFGKLRAARWLHIDKYIMCFPSIKRRFLIT